MSLLRGSGVSHGFVLNEAIYYTKPSCKPSCRNREKVGNVEMPFSRSGKSGIQLFATSKTELRNYATYRNGRPLFGKFTSKDERVDLDFLGQRKIGQK